MSSWSQLRGTDAWSWTILNHSHSSFTCLTHLALEAGEHVLRVAPREPVHIDLFAVTDNPGIFE